MFRYSTIKEVLETANNSRGYSERLFGALWGSDSTLVREFQTFIGCFDSIKEDTYYLSSRDLYNLFYLLVKNNQDCHYDIFLKAFQKHTSADVYYRTVEIIGHCKSLYYQGGFTEKKLQEVMQILSAKIKAAI